MVTFSKLVQFHPIPEFVLVDNNKYKRCVSSAVVVGNYVNVGESARWPYNMLSRYATAPSFCVSELKEMRDCRWCSVHAAYECFSRVSVEDWPKFETAGCFSRLVYGASRIIASKVAAQKLVFRYCEDEMKKKPGMDGYMSKLCLEKSPPVVRMRKEHEQICDVNEKMHCLVLITAARVRADERARRVLLSTTDKLLVNFNRLAEADVKTGRFDRAVWGGCVSKTNGRLYGCNLMGEVLMRVRDIIISEEKKDCDSEVDCSLGIVVRDKKRKRPQRAV